jgi:hypothetical protein
MNNSVPGGRGCLVAPVHLASCQDKETSRAPRADRQLSQELWLWHQLCCGRTSHGACGMGACPMSEPHGEAHAVTLPRVNLCSCGPKRSRHVCFLSHEFKHRTTQASLAALLSVSTTRVRTQARGRGCLSGQSRVHTRNRRS